MSHSADTTDGRASPFRPALLVVDIQEDFCPPEGALAVEGGRDIVPLINDLLQLPFVLKVATKDHHPPDHVSFASNHPGAQPFVSTTTIVNPANPRETYETRLWPAHCVVGTPGNALVPELDAARVGHVVLKGREPRVEMYSAFRSPLRDPPLASAVSDLAEQLAAARATDVFVVGLAGDYCVKNTALDSARLGWRTYVVEEGTRCVGGDRAWAETVAEMRAEGVEVVHADGPEVESVKALSS
ncbi:isochorismatase family hydrolase [Dichomitus squalens LYAD-421 SS1]|uniref:nicotinamidase n=1 Tax=Dichomitus squalens (strain LYAD-421) TaxID=732165 RepID=R7T2J1_DICSQ|nr:isochorismatase family hydrolase [Dichomitus squalens LYAD-421 SS1]EJF62375.1 isochorismatase family hydrolase [Dichomitus squalens LYAD-421 SS1]